MTNYEVLYIVSPKTEEGAREELIERYKNLVVSAGGSAEVNKWGMRKLAYRIGFVNEGYYVLMTFTAPEELPAELERQMRINDSVIRFMVTKKVENKLTRAEDARKAKAAEKAAAAARAREEAAAKEAEVREEHVSAEVQSEAVEPAAEVNAEEVQTEAVSEESAEKAE